MTDNERYFRDLFDDANRANVSFYPIDPRGLAGLRHATSVPTRRCRQRPIAPCSNQRIETLRTLAENTDGIALVNSNDLTKQMRRLADDLTSYYLLGYSSTNAKLDGGFRTIKVGVAPRRRRPRSPRLPRRNRRGAHGGQESGRHATTAGRRRPERRAGAAFARRARASTATVTRSLRRTWRASP